MRPVLQRVNVRAVVMDFRASEHLSENLKCICRHSQTVMYWREWLNFTDTSTLILFDHKIEDVCKSNHPPNANAHQKNDTYDAASWSMHLMSAQRHTACDVCCRGLPGPELNQYERTNARLGSFSAELPSRCWRWTHVEMLSTAPPLGGWWGCSQRWRMPRTWARNRCQSVFARADICEKTMVLARSLLNIDICKVQQLVSSTQVRSVHPAVISLVTCEVHRWQT